MSPAFETVAGLAQQVVTWASEHRANAAAAVILATAAAATAIVMSAPPQPGGAKPVNYYRVASAVGNDPLRLPYPVRAPLPLPPHYTGVYQPADAGSYIPSGTQVRGANRPPEIAIYHGGWYQRFETAFADRAAAAGAVPLLQIEPRGVSLAAIAGGSYDSYLRAYADAVAAYRGAVIIGFGPEMNEHRYPWGYLRTSPAVFVRAWQRIVDTFRSQNADNVTWIWTIGKTSVTARSLRNWWPGAGYVTWVGIDGYYGLPARAHTSPFAGTIARVRRITGDPVLLFEDGEPPP